MCTVNWVTRAGKPCVEIRTRRAVPITEQLCISYGVLRLCMSIVCRACVCLCLFLPVRAPAPPLQLLALLLL